MLAFVQFVALCAVTGAVGVFALGAVCLVADRDKERRAAQAATDANFDRFLTDYRASWRAGLERSTLSWELEGAVTTMTEAQFFATFAPVVVCEPYTPTES